MFTNADELVALAEIISESCSHSSVNVAVLKAEIRAQHDNHKRECGCDTPIDAQCCAGIAQIFAEYLLRRKTRSAASCQS